MFFNIFHFSDIINARLERGGVMEDAKRELRESFLFSQKLAQLSKALWKAIEKDCQEWIKPFNLNINEYYILLIAYNLNGATISDIAKFGVMHVSTAFNFSKKLEERGLLQFSKREHDKRNTYIQITEKGIQLMENLMREYDPINNSVYQGAIPLKDLYGKFPEVMELMIIVRNIYGDDFMEIFEKIFTKMEKDFHEREIDKLEVDNAV